MRPTAQELRTANRLSYAAVAARSGLLWTDVVAIENPQHPYVSKIDRKQAQKLAESYGLHLDDVAWMAQLA